MRERLGLYFLIAVLLPLGLGTLVSERLIERHINGLVHGAATERLEMVLERLNDQGRMARADLGQIAAAAELAGPSVLDDQVALSALLHGRARKRLDLLWLVSRDGRLVGRAAPGPVGADLRAIALVRRALAGESLSSFEELDASLLPDRRRRAAGARDEVLLQAAAVPLRQGNAVIGAIVGGTVLAGNDAFCAQLVDQESSSAALTGRSAVLAVSTAGRRDGGAEGGPRAGAPLSPLQAQAIRDGERWMGPAGDDVFAALAPLLDAAGQRVGGVLVHTSIARFTSLRADARGSFIMAMGAGAMISLLLALLAARQITGPLRRLAQAAADMEKGKLDVPIPREGNDEVAQLAVALERTAGALSESMGTLESRVRERTAELVEARDREAALNRGLTAQNERLQVQGEQLRAQGEVLEQQRRELEEKTRRSEEADRLKNAFIANMSHEIRTPLNSVLALSQLLRDGMAGSLSLDQRKYLEVIERNGQNLLRLINDILDLSRIEAGHLEMDLRAVELEPLLRATVAALAPLGDAKGLDVQAKIPPGLPLVRCDVDRVRQVLTNLVGNAIKFTEAGQVQVSAEARDGFVAIHVTDTGVGIPHAFVSRIFQEFFQVDQTLARRQGGTGLGLAIASRLAHLMGGDITVQSVVGTGSRFTFTLPRATVTDAPGTADVAPADAGAPLEGTLLLVDDDEGDRRATTAALEGAGLRVTAAASGDEALRLLRERAFDAVVADLFMPGLNGFDLVGEARQDPRLARLPIVVLTAHDLTAADRAALGAPVRGFVRKGDTMRAGLLATVRKVLEAREGHGQARAPGQGDDGLPPRSASILLVEDNEDNLFTLKQILNGVAVELATANSGREAIEYCRRRRPDLIIMDMQMPGMSGLQATGAIRALPGGAAIPIVALTAQAMKGDRERILAAGCDEYLAKPIQPRLLLAVIERLLGARDERARGGAGESDDDRQLRAVSRGEKGQHGSHTPRR